MRPGEAAIDVAVDGARVVARLAGELDLGTVPEIEDRLRSSLTDNPRELVIDLGDLEFLDSTGTALLFQLASEAQTQRRALVVVAPPGSPAARLLGIVRFEQAATVVASR